ncbi:MAG TPA: DUF6364 family protein [Mucilaginibacter sp.]
MKAKLNLTVDNKLLSATKVYAKRKHTSVSALVEDYFKTIIKAPRRESILDLVEQLTPPIIDVNTDLKELYHQNQAKKYGF